MEASSFVYRRFLSCLSSGIFLILGIRAVALETIQSSQDFKTSFIRLNVGDLDTRVVPNITEKSFKKAQWESMNLVQFDGPITAQDYAFLEESDLEIVSYIPDNSYLVIGSSASLLAIQKTGSNKGMIWQGEFQSSYKIQPSVTAGLGKGQQLENLAGDGLYVIQLFTGKKVERNQSTLAKIEAVRTDVIRRDTKVLQYRNIIVALPHSAVLELAQQPDVVSIDRYMIPQKNCERQDVIVSGNLIGNNPSNMNYLAWLTSQGFNQAQFDASGFAVNVTDSGVEATGTNATHFGLRVLGIGSSRVIYKRLEGVPHAGSTLLGIDGHGNINAHIIGGYAPDNLTNGFPHADVGHFRYGLGVCPFVKIGSSVIFDPNTFTFPDYENLESKAYQDGARISANSWGANVGGAYTTDAQAYDALVRDAQPTGSTAAAAGNQDYVIVFANGNAGPGGGSVGSPASAKNVLSVGAAENVQSFGGADGCLVPDTSANSANDIVDFSSRGPCQDGRQKPEIVAPGTHISGGVIQNNNPPANGDAHPSFTGDGMCGGPNNSAFFPLGQEWYSASSGTSHSTPALVGGCALIRQKFINQGLNPPSAALTKAMLINSARYMTGVDANDHRWSPNQGMGMMNLGALFEMFETPTTIFDQNTNEMFTASGQTKIYHGAIANLNKEFRVTLAWTEPPGSTVGNAFVNNLNLEVTAGGNTYRGNRFNGAYSTIGGNADSANNVESVILPAGVSGSFIVKVTASNIAGDGVPNVGTPLDQDFALVIYNATGTSQDYSPVIQPGQLSIITESFNPTNQAADPGETISVRLPLVNVGNTNAINLTAALLATNGITPLSGAQNYGSLIPNVSATNDFICQLSGNFSLGTNVPLVFSLQNDGTNFGTVVALLLIGKLEETCVTNSNSNVITIMDNSTASSSILISGLTGSVTKVRATLLGVSHTYAGDLDILLRSSNNTQCILTSDAGGGNNLAGNYTFDEAALSPFGSVLNGGNVVPGTYRPIDIGSGDPFDGVPVGTRMVSLNSFNGMDPNGIWTLYVVDDAGGDVGQLANGWRLEVCVGRFTSVISEWPSDLSIGVSDLPDPITAGDVFTYHVFVTNHGPQMAQGVTVAQSLPNGVNYISSVPSAGNVSVMGSQLVWQAGSLDSNAIADLLVTVQPIFSVGTITSVVNVSSTTLDTNSANNIATATTLVDLPPGNADLAVVLNDSQDPVSLSNLLTYTVTVKNLGSDTAYGIVVTNWLSSSMTFQAAIPSVGVVSSSADPMVWVIPNLLGGRTEVLTLIVKPNILGSFSAMSQIQAATPDPNSANNFSTAVTQVGEPIPPQAILPLVKSDFDTNGFSDLILTTKIKAGQKRAFALSIVYLNGGSSILNTQVIGTNDCKSLIVGVGQFSTNLPATFSNKQQSVIFQSKSNFHSSAKGRATSNVVKIAELGLNGVLGQPKTIMMLSKKAQVIGAGFYNADAISDLVIQEKTKLGGKANYTVSVLLSPDYKKRVSLSVNSLKKRAVSSGIFNSNYVFGVIYESRQKVNGVKNRLVEIVHYVSGNSSALKLNSFAISFQSHVVGAGTFGSNLVNGIAVQTKKGRDNQVTLTLPNANQSTDLSVSSEVRKIEVVGPK